MTSELGGGEGRPATDVVVVLPVYGGGGGLPSIMRDLTVAAYGLRTRAMKMSVVLVDGSGNGEVSEVLAIADDHSLSVERIPGPDSGSGQAYLEGFRVALERGANLIVTLDANGRHDATEIPRLVDRLVEKDVDVVIGSRWTRGSGTPGLTPLRWLLGRAANYVFRVLTGTYGIADATTSFRVARAETLRGFQFGDVPVNSHSV